MKYLKCSCPHCAGHLEYPSKAAGLPISCPHCAATFELPLRLIRYWPIAAALLVLLLSAAIYLSTRIVPSLGIRAITVAIGALCALLFVFGVYFAPAIIAVARQHRNWIGISIINLAFGWTVLGWIGALVWAVHRDPGSAPVPFPKPVLAALAVAMAMCATVAGIGAAALLHQTRKPFATADTIQRAPLDGAIPYETVLEADRITSQLAQTRFYDRTEYEGSILKVWVGPGFYSVDAHQKEIGATAIFINFAGSRKIIDHVEFYDHQTDRFVARFTTSKRLEIF
jgi:hypothetical protein